MAATVSISESNGAGETVTASVSNINYGSTDAVNLVPADYPITRGTYSYEKWNRYNVTDMGTSTKIDNLQVWKSAGTLSLGSSGTMKANLVTSGYTAETYSTPVNTQSTKADTTFPTSDPGTANIGISGSLTGSLTSTGYSDYIVSQIYVDTDAPVGPHAQLTITFQWDEQ